MDKINTPLADFLLDLLSSAEKIMAYETDKEMVIANSNLDSKIKELLLNGSHDDIKRKLYEERGLDHDLPSMYTMTKIEIADLIEDLVV